MDTNHNNNHKNINDNIKNIKIKTNNVLGVYE